MNTPIKLQATHYENLFRALLQSINEFSPGPSGISYEEGKVQLDYWGEEEKKENLPQEYFMKVTVCYGFWSKEHRFSFDGPKNDYPVHDILRERAYSFLCSVIVNRGWRALFWPTSERYPSIEKEAAAYRKADDLLNAYNEFCAKEASRSYGIVEEDA